LVSEIFFLLSLITVEEGGHDHIILYHCASGFFLKRRWGWFVWAEKERGDSNICYV
jgi:hypothetical protein